MAKLNITEAAQQVGISRTNLYKNYINKGKLSVTVNSKGQKEIDMSELIRVFGELQGNTLKNTQSDNQKKETNTAEFMVMQERLKGLEALLETREQELQEYREREKHYRTLLLGFEKKEPKKWFWWLGKG